MLEIVNEEEYYLKLKEEFMPSLMAENINFYGSRIEVICYQCGEQGHFRRNCPSRYLDVSQGFQKHDYSLSQQQHERFTSQYHSYQDDNVYQNYSQAAFIDQGYM